MPVAPRYFMGRWLYAKYDVCVFYGDKNWAYFQATRTNRSYLVVFLAE